MMKLLANKWIVVLLSIGICNAITAQSFRYAAKLNPVKESRFYAVPVTPVLSAYMQVDFRDVRLWDEKEKQVPYIIRSRKRQWQPRLFQPFFITENTLDDSSRSLIVVKKNTEHPIAGLSLILRNAAVSRYASLSGSNDGKKWFIISEGILVNDSYETISDSSIQSVSFPPSSYTFFRLIIDNQKTDPLNVLSIGYYPNSQFATVDPYQANPQPQIFQNDSSNGVSYINVAQSAAYPVSKLLLEIEGPKFFARKISLYLPVTNNRKRNLPEVIFSGSISSSGKFEIPVPFFKSKDFILAIDNGDNPPLRVKAVSTWQEYHEIVAWLEAGKEYRLVTDAAAALAPNYDLSQFSDSIPAEVPQVTVQPLQPLKAILPDDNKDGFLRKFIWLIMIGVVALLSLLTWRLTAEMRKNQ